MKTNNGILNDGEYKVVVSLKGVQRNMECAISEATMF